jgi:transposase
MMTIAILGIDVAKNKIDVELLRNDKFRSKVFANKAVGFAELAAWLKKHQVNQVHACMEATGTYWEALAEFLHAQGHKVSVVNPVAIHHYGKSQLSRNKTDQADAKLIARYCANHQDKVKAWSPPPAAIKQLQALVRRLDSLKLMQQEEKNRLASGVEQKDVLNSLQTNISFLEQQIAEMEKLIKEHIDNNPELKQQKDLLLTIPGIGDTTAAAFLAEMVNINDYTSARQAAAYAGVTPKRKESNTIKGKVKLVKIGNSRIRKALYMPAVVAKRYNPIIKDFCQRLEARGKTGKAIIGAAMRKLVHLAYGVLHSGKAFDANYLSLRR